MSLYNDNPRGFYAKWGHLLTLEYNNILNFAIKQSRLDRQRNDSRAKVKDRKGL